MAGETQMQPSLPLQVEFDQAASSQEVASQRSTRFVWTGLGVAAVLMPVGVSACALFPHASPDSAKPSEVAFSPALPAPSPGGIHLSSRTRALPTGIRSAVKPVVRRPTAERAKPASMQMGPLTAIQGGYEFVRQATAAAFPGDYNKDFAMAEVKRFASCAPLVIFISESSPACKKALKYLNRVEGITMRIVRLDDTWSEGNARRAALGRLTGTSSVPSIWIGGEYIGGFEDGVGSDAPGGYTPGLVPLAFKGQLQSKLEAAGAINQYFLQSAPPLAAPRLGQPQQPAHSPA
jgi:glutaredoxin